LDRLGIRCPRCGSVLLRVQHKPEERHIDVFCAVCEEFTAHFWYERGDILKHPEDDGAVVVSSH